MPDTTVKLFRSTDAGAPTIGAAAGSLIAVLDACLVTGYGAVTVNTLSVVSGVATAIVSAGHGLTMAGSTGPVMRIAGATPSGLNGDWRATVVNSTTFTFATTAADGTASGTITAQRAPAGWEKAFSGTNLAAYRSTDLAATGCYLRVDDPAGSGGTCLTYATGYATMSDIDTGTDSFISRSGVIYRGGAGGAWFIIADSRAMYIFVGALDNYLDRGFGGYYFGDIVNCAPDPYACGFVATQGSYYGAELMYLYEGSAQNILKFPRSYTGLGAAVGADAVSHRLAGKLPYPNPVNNALMAYPVGVLQAGGIYRGDMPGYYAPAHNLYGAGVRAGQMFSLDGIGAATRDFIALSSTSTCGLFDITGPWR